MNRTYILLYALLVLFSILESGCVVVRVPPSSEVRDINISIYKSASGENNDVDAETAPEIEAGYTK
jgi:hypothetical protein